MTSILKQIALATLVTLITTGVAAALPLQKPDKPATHDIDRAYARMIAPGG
jgi:hypothetical protein